ncbi:MAG: B12-binding domain-containing radical SAM protein [Thermohalobaculum sp.]
MRKKILIVNAFFDDFRRTTGSPWRIPRGSGPVFLAGAFNPATTEVRLYSEQTDGYLLDADVLGWPDMLVLTGLTSGLDRMLHLAAYAKTRNPRVITVAGGPAVRALPRFAARHFDHVCLGDVEELRGVAITHWGEDVAAPPGDLFPRFDLADRRGRIGYVESSRYCNFKCTFCSLTGEGRRYRTYDLDHVRRQIEATGKRQIIFLDNNFYGNDRQYYFDRVEMLADLKRRGTIDGWSALVTGDFFARDANIEAAARAGCVGLFSGVESFDQAQLTAFNKKQNRAVPQVEMIRNCLDHGILFLYGIMLDPSSRRIADLEREIDFILSMPEITLPAYFTLPIPLLGTPYFEASRDQGLILPKVSLRDMTGVPLLMKPLDGIEEATRFARRLVDLKGRRAKVLGHAARFGARYARRLSPLQHTIALASGVLTTFPGFATSPLKPRLRAPAQTFYGPTEPLDPAYTPALPVDPAFAHHFRPTMVTDTVGRIAPELAADLTPATTLAPLQRQATG